MAIDKKLVSEFILALTSDEHSVGIHDVVPDWHIHAEDAEVSDDIRDYPEIWDSMDFPEVLVNLTSETHVGLCRSDDRLNLNAMAIGLGLEDIEYEPVEFPGLVYHLDVPDVTVLCFPRVIVSISEDKDDTVEAVEKVLKRLMELGIAPAENPEDEWYHDKVDAIQSMTVSEAIETQPDDRERKGRLS